MRNLSSAVLDVFSLAVVVASMLHDNVGKDERQLLKIFGFKLCSQNPFTAIQVAGDAFLQVLFVFSRETRFNYQRYPQPHEGPHGRASPGAPQQDGGACWTAAEIFNRPDTKNSSKYNRDWVIVTIQKRESEGESKCSMILWRRKTLYTNKK